MISVGLLLICGLLMSAFFSGSETGLYRVTRIRLALDGMSGDPVSKGLLWLVNNPAIFVATTLIGNNIANYMVSFSIVLATQLMLGGHHAVAEVMAPIIVAPIVFVYGELLPKNLFYLAPNRLMRLSGPFLLIASFLFSPVTAILWGLSRMIQRVVGESPVLIRMQLARKELQKLLEEGHQVGILTPLQSRMSQAIIDYGNETIGKYGTPISRLSSVTTRDPLPHLLRTARRQHAAELLVFAADRRTLEGYVRVIDLHLCDGSDWQSRITPLQSIPRTDHLIAAIMTLQTNQEPLAKIVNAQGTPVGILKLEKVLESLLGSSSAGAAQPNRLGQVDQGRDSDPSLGTRATASFAPP